MLKKSLIFLTVLFLLPQTILAEENWHIEKFNVEINVADSGAMLVQEEITADFSKTSKRGIVRTIPIRFKDRFNTVYKTAIYIISITDNSGNLWNYSKSYSGRDISIRVGDEDKYYSEPLDYNITYTLNNSVSFFEDHDEVYINITGTKTPVVTKNASATINLPENLTEKDIEVECFTGKAFSTSSNCEITKTQNIVEVISTKDLAPFEGLTVAISIPKETLIEPTIIEKTTRFLWSNMPLLIPVITFIFMFILWLTRGRDPRTKEAIIPFYDKPNDLTPTEMGAIIDDQVNPKDITVAIIDLATRGYIEIHEITKKKMLFGSKSEITFIRKKEFTSDDTLRDFEKTILNGLFKNSSKVKLNDLEYKFHETLEKASKEVYAQITKKGHFIENPSHTRYKYLAIGVSVGLIVTFFATIPYGYADLGAPIGIVSGLIIIAFGYFMPRKTLKGAKALKQSIGFKEFIKTAEKDRIEFFQNLNDKEKIKKFEKLLPYAIALGVGNQWSKLFKDIYKVQENPLWYSGNYLNTFDAIRLTDRLNSIQSLADSTLSARPESARTVIGKIGSGGFSGGGFGGGGVGSW